VPSHGDPTGPRVLLVNEAPGPDEAVAGIPLFGMQGANLFHALQSAGIGWATSSPKFVWPCRGGLDRTSRHVLKALFLEERSRNITCTNAFPQWPKPSVDLNGFCAPSDRDVLSQTNLRRLQSEIAETHSVVLVCGRSAYLACIGSKLQDPETRERSELLPSELSALSARLGGGVKSGWYMGHTRRWLTKADKTRSVLQQVAHRVGWKVVSNEG
jgi:hypothetical protein